MQLASRERTLEAMRKDQAAARVELNALIEAAHDAWAKGYQQAREELLGKDDGTSANIETARQKVIEAVAKWADTEEANKAKAQKALLAAFRRLRRVPLGK